MASTDSSTTENVNWHTFNDRIDPHSLISLIPIHRSQNVIVIGASPEGLAIPIAKYVYDGKLTALDEDQTVLEALSVEMSRLNLTNITPLNLSDDEVAAKNDYVDGAVLADVLCATSGQKKMLTRIARQVRKGGWMLVIDWIPVERITDHGPARSYRVDPQKVMRWASEVNMIPITRRILGSSHYVHVYRKHD